MISYLSTFLVLIGLIIQAATLAPLKRLMAMLPAGSLRNKWYAMAGLVLLFMAGYFGYIVVLWGRPPEWHEILIPGIFLFGAIFVWLTINLSLQTAADLLRMDLLEVENITDPLTKVYNRRYLVSRLEEEVERSRRYSLELSIFMLDIDHFKRVNDTYGHQAGDFTLSTLATLLKAALRKLDVIARYGGEEFLVICPNTAIDGAALVAGRLRQLVESHQFEIPDSSGGKQFIQISISIGVASMGATVDTLEKLVQTADQALYRAKSGGRNRVIAAETAVKESAIPN